MYPVVSHLKDILRQTRHYQLYTLFAVAWKGDQPGPWKWTLGIPVLGEGPDRMISSPTLRLTDRPIKNSNKRLCHYVSKFLSIQAGIGSGPVAMTLSSFSGPSSESSTSNWPGIWGRFWKMASVTQVRHFASYRHLEFVREVTKSEHFAHYPIPSRRFLPGHSSPDSLGLHILPPKFGSGVLKVKMFE